MSKIDRFLKIDQEDDSPYLSMADFFSLLSLTLIFATVVLTPAPSTPEKSVQVTAGRLSKIPLDGNMDLKTVYVALRPTQDDEAELRVARAGMRTAQSIQISTVKPDYANIEKWLKSEMEVGSPPSSVVFYYDGDRTQRNAYVLLLDLVRDLQGGYNVSVAFLE